MADAHPLRWGGVPVPYTAMWSAEAAARVPSLVEVRWDGIDILMLSEGVHNPAGKPLFTMLHTDRARHVVRDRLCQMCLAPLPSEVVTINQGQKDRHSPLINDGLPMCRACALAAFEACPGMQRQAAAGDLRIWLSPVGAWRVAPVLLGIVPEAEGGDAAVNAVLRSARGHVFTGPKLVLTSWQGLSIDDLKRGMT